MSELEFDLFEALNQPQAIFKNEKVFEPNYFPDQLLHRKKELIQLANHFRSIANQGINYHGQKVIIQGPVGSGKTLTAKYFGHALEKHSRENTNSYSAPLFFFHLNCRRQRSWYMIFTTILRHLVPAFPLRGYSSDELLSFLIRILEERNQKLLLCLDEIDYLLTKSKGQDILYSLIRHYEGIEQNEKARISLILITRNLQFQQLLDSTLLSSLSMRVVAFEPYTPSQLADILALRAKSGLVENSYTQDLIAHIVNLSGNASDARLAIELLWRSAKMAEQSNDTQIRLEHVQKAQASIFPIKQSVITELSSQLKNVLLALTELLKNKDPHSFVTTKELWAKYEDICFEKNITPRKQTQFWKYLQELANQELVELEVQNRHINGKSAGRTTYITLSELPAERLQLLVS